VLPKPPLVMTKSKSRTMRLLASILSQVAVGFD
jgi:hypothetical protein